MKIAQKEHDYFAHTLEKQGVHVVYLEDLLAQSLTNKDVRTKFVDQLLEESNIK